MCVTKYAETRGKRTPIEVEDIIYGEAMATSVEENGGGGLASTMEAEEAGGLPYDIEEDESCGRYLAAGRDIQLGEEILTELPTGDIFQGAFSALFKLPSVFLWAWDQHRPIPAEAGIDQRRH